MDILKTVRNTMNRNKMTEPGTHVIAAVSGGADSICLLWVLKQLSGPLEITLEAFHLHHGIRGGEADRDADFVEHKCREWEIPVTVRREQVKEYAAENGLSVEEAGRMLRYESLEALRLQAEKERNCKAVIAVAHHRGDSAETILHNLFRGSGLKGLRGILPVRDGIIRPFIDVSREEIEEFLTSRKIPWCEDSTNQDNDYTRNKIRNCILPMVRREINQEADLHILQAGRLLSMADDFLEKTAEKLWEKWGEYQEGKGCSFPIPVMEEQEEIVRYYLIRRMIAEAGIPLKDFSFAHIEAAEKLAGGRTGRMADLPKGVKCWKEYGSLWIGIKKEAKLYEEKGEADFEIFSYKKGVKIPKNQYTKWFDYDKMENMPCLRFREPGDYITLTGGGRKSVKAFMIDEKIPRDLRGRIPVLAEGKHIVWIVGYRISEYYKVTEETENILQVHFNGGKEDGREGTGIIR